MVLNKGELMLLFHGTTLENALNIKKNGFSYSKQIWDCSLKETYFFTEEYFIDEVGEDVDFADFFDYAIRETLDQARITLACENPSIYKGAVLVFDTNLMDNKDSIEADYSCENMDNMAVALVEPDMKGLVAVITSKEDERESRPFILATMIDREFFCTPEMSETTWVIVNALKDNQDSYSVLENLRCSDNYQIDWINNNFFKINQDHFQGLYDEGAVKTASFIF